MAPRTKYRKRKRRTVAKRRKKRTYIPPLWPNRKVARLRYGDAQPSSSSIAGAAVMYSWTCNGMYDPNITGTGAQPRGFDQIMPFYDHYVVIGAKCVVTFQNDSEEPVRVGILIRDVSSVSQQSPDTIQEYRHKRTITLDGITRGGRSFGTVSYKVNPNKFLSRSHPLSDDQLKGSALTNPAEQCFFQTFAYALDGVSIATVRAQVRIEYTAVFIEPKIGTGS